MPQLQIDTLQPDQIFSGELTLDRLFLLLPAKAPVSQSLINALKNWGFEEITSETEIKTPAPQEESTFEEDEEIKVESKISDDDITDSLKEASQITQGSNEFARMDAAQKVFDKYMDYIRSLYTHYATHKEFDKEQLSSVVKELCVYIRENRRYVLRINPKIDASSKDFLVNHSMRSTVLAITIGLRLHMPFTQLVELGVACILHEIGMLKLPPQLYMTERRLQPQEKAKLASHPLLGYELLKDAEFSLSVQRAVLEHHEHENGSGYPRHIATDQISTNAKIISVACSFEAISAPRQYKAMRSSYDAMLELLKNQSHQYDDKVIKALLYSVSLFPIGVYVYLANGKVGQVSDTNPDNPKYPVISILGEKAADGDLRTVDADEGTNKIVRVLNPQEVEDVKKSLGIN